MNKQLTLKTIITVIILFALFAIALLAISNVGISRAETKNINIDTEIMYRKYSYDIVTAYGHRFIVFTTPEGGISTWPLD